MRLRPVALAMVLVAGFTMTARAQKAFDAPDVVKPGPGVKSPVAISEVKPKYTKDALRERIQGTAEVEVVVQANGKVQDARIHKSLDSKYGLDKEALKTAKALRFTPAMRDGKPVKAVVVIPIAFRDPSIEADIEFERGAVDGDTPGLVKPRVTWEEKPRYTSEAMRQKIQGVAQIQVVIGTDGRVQRARVLKSLDKTFGLDQEALDAALRWRFEPGRLNGKPVPVLATLQLEFQLH